ncbi:MAG: pseudouridine synthase [Candidatus Eremiobacteraeota bacterium]|nr:pseudouridine synthase [Candidatus Eremiobacteraeota bacterium]
MILVFHKPYGVLSQYKPSGEKRTLLEFPALSGGKAVGRLDEDSEGLLVISELPWVQTLLTTPGRVEKTYWAQVERLPETEALQQLRQGVRCGDFTSAPAQARLLPDLQIPPRNPPIRHRLNVPTAWLELQLREGKNRQVRRMTAAVGHPTLRLLRAAIGPIQLGALAAGECRELTRPEREWLNRLGRR